MPLVTLEVLESVPVATRRRYLDAIHEGLVEGLGMDAEDRFQVVHLVPEGGIVADPHYLGGDRRDVVYVRVQMVRMYDTETKNRMYDAVARRLEAEGVRPDDVFIVVTQNGLDDWYPGARGAR